VAVAFVCRDCWRSVTQFTRGDPTAMRRCVDCERQHTQRIANRLLTLAFGPDPG